MTSITTHITERRAGVDVPEEEIILARFSARVSEGTSQSLVAASSDCSFLVL
jgi:hypothetical protein